MRINDIELGDLDLTDAETLERIETAQKEYTEKSKKRDFEKASEMIKYHCKIVFDFFNTIFGEDTAKRVFKGKYNLTICLEAVSDLAEYIQSSYSNKNFGKYLDRLRR